MFCVYACSVANTRGVLTERQKAERLQRQLKKRLEKADDPEDKASIEKEVHIADVDCYYTRYFPFMEPYVSLYPVDKTKDESGDGPIAKRALHSERPPVWKEIEEAAEQGQKALEAIQERRPEKTESTESAPRPRAAPKAPPKDKFDGMSQERRLRLGKPEGEKGPVKVAKNRRERRKQQRLHQEEKKVVEESADDSDGSGFFDA